MSYQLYIGDYAYSSWSLRGWLLLRRFGISADVTLVDFAEKSVAEHLQNVGPAKTVPTLIDESGTIVWDSLAMAEELASRHPNAGIWPDDPAARATARSLTAEMHSGFSALRNACPMNMRKCYVDFPVSDAVQEDLNRLQQIWDYARQTSGGTGPWLCGTYSAADAFFAPVAARIAGYQLPVSPSAQAYVDAHLADPAFRRWRAMGLVHGQDLERYAMTYDSTDWPGPAPRRAQSIETGTSVNETCPYSGKDVTHLMEMDGKVYGFCNAFCRDKTVADPETWPDFMAIVR